MAGRSAVSTVIKAKEAGFTIILYYIGLESAELAIQRVRMRVAKGGHGIDDDLIRKRYEASLINLKKIVPLCDKVTIYDNTNNFQSVAAFNKKCQWKIYSCNCEWFRKSFPEILENHSHSTSTMGSDVRRSEITARLRGVGKTDSVKKNKRGRGIR